MLDTKRIRSQIAYLQRELEIKVPNRNGNGRVFVDNTASTQLSLPVIESLIASAFTYSNIHRGKYNASRLTTEEFERTYNVAANFVNADSWREIVFGRNTTEMINLVRYTLSWEFENGDNIVTTRLEHNSNYVPWWHLQKTLAKHGKNVEIRIADFDKESGELNEAQLEEMVDEKTKLVAVSGASNFLGTKPKLKKIGKIAHASGYKQPNGITGSYFLVDGAQLVPCSPVDVKEIDCDFLAWSLHKMGVPLGVGGLYGKKRILDSIQPFLTGGDMIESVHEGDVKLKETPWKFTAGTPNILGTISTAAGIYFLVNAGMSYLNPENKCNRILTEILLNTPRGEDFKIKYSVPEESTEEFQKYLDECPEIVDSLKDPEVRLSKARNLVKAAMSNVELHQAELVQYTIDELSKIPEVTLYGPRNAGRRAGMVSFNVAGVDDEVVASYLNTQKVEIRNGDHCASLAHNHLGVKGSARISFYIYNNLDEAASAVGAVKKLVGSVRNGN